MNQRNPVIIVQGGQWGSEAKGAVAANLCIERGVDATVRTGAINAGHTVVYNGERFAMQQIPVGWVNPDTLLIIGPGAYIHPQTLWNEIDMINRAQPQLDVRKRLFIDYRCAIHDIAAEEASKVAGRHHKMGATGKGCSEAIVAKIQNRGNDGYELFMNSDAGRAFRARNPDVKFVDTVKMLNTTVDIGNTVLIEGTQGTLLDMHIGPFPYTTSRMTSAANWVAEAGLSPSLNYEVVLVCRTHPIRVAGNSGPMDNEIEWVDLARRVNSNLITSGKPPLIGEWALVEFEDAISWAAKNATYPVPVGPNRLVVSKWTADERKIYRVAASELHRDALNHCNSNTVMELKKLFEMTTVTKKLRRIADISHADLQYSVDVNRPAWICLTFMDYEFPELRNATGATINELVANNDPIINAVLDYGRHIQSVTSTKVGAFQFGPYHHNLVPVHQFYGQASTR